MGRVEEGEFTPPFILFQNNCREADMNKHRGWNELSSMHEHREQFAAVEHKKKIYAFGGSSLNSAECYNIGKFNSSVLCLLPHRVVTIALHWLIIFPPILCCIDA